MSGCACGHLLVRRMANPGGNPRHDMLWIERADHHILLTPGGITRMADIEGACSLDYPLDATEVTGGKAAAVPFLSDREGWTWTLRTANATVVYLLGPWEQKYGGYTAAGLGIGL